jgi:hypothetical protein
MPKGKIQINYHDENNNKQSYYATSIADARQFIHRAKQLNYTAIQCYTLNKLTLPSRFSGKK